MRIFLKLLFGVIIIRDLTGLTNQKSVCGSMTMSVIGQSRIKNFFSFEKRNTAFF